MVKDTKTLSVQSINREIETQLGDKETAQALIATTFKEFSVPMVKQALLEGMMRGFTFQNFLDKDVFALKYGGTYSLVTSIDYSRKLAMNTGEYAGKSEPTYEDDANDRPKTCSITVKRLINGTIAEFTAKVYFSEYTTQKNQWVAKPRTMIAKVAEMHALRMAFPNELAKAYIEEETTPSPFAEKVEIDYFSTQEKFGNCKTVDEIREVFAKLPKEYRTDKQIIEMAKNRKDEIENAVKEAVIDPVIDAVAKSPLGEEYADIPTVK